MGNLFEQGRKKFDEAKKKVRKSVDALATEITEKGVANYATEKIVDAAGATGEVVAEITNVVTEGPQVDPAAYRESYRKGATRTAATVRSAAETTGRKARDIANVVSDVYVVTKAYSVQAKTTLEETAADFATPKERIALIGGGDSARNYHINTYSKETVAKVADYLKTASRAIPSATAGRDDVLKFIAAQAISDYARLESEWKEAKQPEVKALTYLAPKAL